jgi:cytochrome c oxidase cbb3-type subunit 3
MLYRLVFSTLLLLSGMVMAGSAEECGQEARSCLNYGAKVFQSRCVLCHGSDGLGEGILPLSLPGYPDTNLLLPKHARDRAAIHRLVVKGNSLDGVSEEMPPWGDELTVTQVDSVVDFIVYMREDLEGALAILRKEAAHTEPSMKVGRAVFVGRCALCHGNQGMGDGKMARIIKDPPPFNLTLSGAADDYLREIITRGGGEMGRSPRMPPWGEELSRTEIDSVILYVKSLRIYGSK